MVLEGYQELDKKSSACMQSFLSQVEANPTFSSTNEKSSFLELLLKDLLNNKEEWGEELKTKALSVVRVLGRDQAGSDPLFTKQGIVALIQLAGLYETSKIVDTPSSQEALKCICNCIFLKDSVKPYLEEEHVVDSCLHVLQSEDHQLGLEIQFLTCRVLFFLTVGRSDLVDSLIKSNVSGAIARVLSDNIAQLEDPALSLTIDRNAAINPLTVTSEALKLLFNLLLVGARSRDGANTNYAFVECLAPILRLLFIVPYPEPQPLIAPYSQAIHALMQFSFTTIAQVWSEQSSWTNTLLDKDDEHGYQYMASTLVDVLDKSIHALLPSGDPDQDGSESVDTAIAPLLLVLSLLAEGDQVFKRVMARSMLPNEKDRLKPVHEGFGLSAYLIRLMTSTMMPQTRDAVCEALFVLCDKDGKCVNRKRER
ncbi:guanine nucleotide exchange factor [Parasitella parasitica]|nr:guanine nucleotide exchange factor [Parasitella parasitica]